jgi:hypothetical protein
VAVGAKNAGRDVCRCTLSRLVVVILDRVLGSRDSVVHDTSFETLACTGMFVVSLTKPL